MASSKERSDAHMKKKIKKMRLFPLTTLFLAAALTGCGSAEPAVPDSGLIQSIGTDVEPSMATSLDDASTASDISNAGDANDTGDTEPLPAVYAKNLLSLSDTATGNGISYSILDVQRTKEFGDRALENLMDLSHGGTDGQGNLLGDEEYLFLMIQFTNTTDQAVEILRNQGGLREIDSEGRVLHCNSEAVYCDRKWEDGTPGEIFHWVLAPNESVTSEIGWLVQGRDEASRELLGLGDSRDWSLYYEVEASEDSSENYYIDLKLEVE
ncbi:MAG TPA: hypothetical protein DCZ91_14145 [Lachnospiraceae bacterium]|nr:hypothetical protein [Lachnospiraceae bacterium]